MQSPSYVGFSSVDRRGRAKLGLLPCRLDLIVDGQECIDKCSGGVELSMLATRARLSRAFTVDGGATKRGVVDGERHIDRREMWTLALDPRWVDHWDS